MPFRCKVQYIFAAGQKGWSEVFYLEPLSGTFSEAASIALSLRVPRARLLGANASMKAVRVQVVQDAAGAKVKRRGDLFQGEGFGGEPTEPNAALDTCLLLDFIDAGQTRHKVMFLGGIWDSIEANNGAYSPSPDWNARLDVWRTQLVAQSFGWVGRTPSAPFAITTYLQNLDGFVQITSAAGTYTGLPLNTPVQIGIQGLQSTGGPSNLNGQLLVRPISATEAITVEQRAVLPYLSGGTVTTYTFAFVKTAAVAAEKIGNRKRGSPLLEPVGRQKATRHV